EPLRERFAELLKAHPLGREIAVSHLINELIYRMGMTFVSRRVRELGVKTDDVVRAYRAAELLLHSDPFIDQVRDLLAAGGISPALGQELLLLYRGACEEAVTWLVRSWPYSKDGIPGNAQAVVKRLRPAFRRTLTWLTESSPPALRERVAARKADLAARGVPEDLAARGASLEVERHV